MQTYVVVGAGHAGSRGADCLRRAGFKGRIIMIGEEPYLPYQRPPLCKKFLADELPIERMVLRHGSFYRRSNIELLLNTRVLAIDRGRQRLALANGEEVPFDKLLLCSGSRPRTLDVPGQRLPGIHAIRTLDDARRFRCDLAAGRRAVIFGGGYIGLETAAILRGLGLHVTIIELADRLMTRVVSPIVADFYLRRHLAAGVNLIFDASVKCISGSQRVEAVQAADGRSFAADVVLVSTGNVPETTLAEAAGLECRDGIIVDARCRTSDANIFAAGDCTNHPSVRYGRAVRLQSIDNAFEQARVAADAMCDRPGSHAHIPWFWSDQYDTKLLIAGLADGSDQDVIRGNPFEHSFSVWRLRDGELLSVEAVNRPQDFIKAGRWIAEHKRPDCQLLQDDAISLDAL